MVSFDSFSLSSIVLIVLGGFAGGLVNGLTGFGTALSAMPFWLQAVSPPVAAQLGAAGGVAGQLLTFRAIWHAIDWRGLAPMLVAGLIGVPLGAALLPYVDTHVFKTGIGVVLVAFAATMLFTRSRVPVLRPRLSADAFVDVLLAGPPPKPRGGAADIVVGFVGGLMGGLAGMSGVAPTIWASLQGWSKERRRGVFQAFNFTILAAVLIAHAVGGFVSPALVTAVLLALPGTLLGVALGQWLFARLDDRGFDHVVLVLLGCAGIAQLVPPG